MARRTERRHEPEGAFLEVVPVIVAALPGIGDLLRYTVAPALGRLQMPLLKWQMFSPAAQPRRVFGGDGAAALANPCDG